MSKGSILTLPPFKPCVQTFHRELWCTKESSSWRGGEKESGNFSHFSVDPPLSSLQQPHNKDKVRTGSEPLLSWKGFLSNALTDSSSWMCKCLIPCLWNDNILYNTNLFSVIFYRQTGGIIPSPLPPRGTIISLFCTIREEGKCWFLCHISVTFFYS